jgi:hypothetical protein
MSVFQAQSIEKLEESIKQFRALLMSWRYKSGCWCSVGKWQVQLHGHQERCIQIKAALDATEGESIADDSE